MRVLILTKVRASGRSLIWRSAKVWLVVKAKEWELLCIDPDACVIMFDIKPNRLVFFRDELGADEVAQVGSEFYNKLVQLPNGDIFFRIYGVTSGSQLMQAGVVLGVCVLIKCWVVL